jgi:hypothetical protein
MNRRQGAQVHIPRLGGFRQRGDALAQAIESDPDAFGIQLAPGIEGLIERFTRHEPGSQALRRRRGLHPSPEVSLARQKEEETAHDLQASTPPRAADAPETYPESYRYSKSGRTLLDCRFGDQTPSQGQTR